MLQGRSSGPAALSATDPGAPPAPSATRRQDKVFTLKSTSAKPEDSVTQKPGLMLAKAFDSYEATMRLAEMTGMGKELTAFADTVPTRTAPATDGSTTATLRDPAAMDYTRAPRADRTRSHTFLWMVTIAALLTAAALLVFR